MVEKDEKEEQVAPKLCPHLDRPCIREECSQYVKIQQQVLGMNKVIGLCAAPATVLVLSRLTQVLIQLQQQRIKPLGLDLPGLGRG